ncbi:hypothetical protein [Rhizobium grahamii]|uniref:Uncharacterized protein n=1 Tax=Rhizobium grahamii CCGE 502 TaxID=990285 RepID=S3IID4_9HYPH|nr:hypothetical protein [Rhizobium grahamii]EPE98628.1 hypothetical protein RGCCGE502_09385 [Rhizobium grahamii CCGE 502]
MIAALTSKWAAYAIGALVAVGLVLLAVNAIYNRGYEAAAEKGRAEVAELKAAAVDARDKEESRQYAANEAAKAREGIRIAEIEAENQSLEQKIEELQRAAKQDPDAGRTALSAPGVRRINKIR